MRNTIQPAEPSSYDTRRRLLDALLADALAPAADWLVSDAPARVAAYG